MLRHEQPSGPKRPEAAATPCRRRHLHVRKETHVPEVLWSPVGQPAGLRTCQGVAGSRSPASVHAQSRWDRGAAPGRRQESGERLCGLTCMAPEPSVSWCSGLSAEACLLWNWRVNQNRVSGRNPSCSSNLLFPAVAPALALAKQGLPTPKLSKRSLHLSHGALVPVALKFWWSQ